MKKISIISACALLLAFIIVIGCKKDKPAPDNNNNTTTTGNAIFWLATDLSCGPITVDCNGVSKTITSFSSNGAPACGASGSATFEFDAGTYTYTAKCSSKTWAGSVTISGGACSKVELKDGAGGGTTGTAGQAMFWSAADLGCGTVTVICNGISKTMSSYYAAGAPACGSAGTATFDLNAGTYSYSAQCSGKTWNGTITVTAGGCSKIQLTGGTNTTTTGQTMFWTASDLGCGTITVTCNGVSKNITSYYAAGAPACGASGNATFDLSPGSYSYSAACTNKTWTGTVTITAGGCSKIQFTAPANTSSTGKATFWVASDLGCGTITVTCNGTTSNITSYYASGAPACGASGCASFTLNPGTYAYSGKCNSKTWSGTVTVTSNGCSTVRFTN